MWMWISMLSQKSGYSVVHSQWPAESNLSSHLSGCHCSWMYNSYYLGNPCEDVSSNTDGQLGHFSRWRGLIQTAPCSILKSLYENAPLFMLSVYWRPEAAWTRWPALCLFWTRCCLMPPLSSCLRGFGRNIHFSGDVRVKDRHKKDWNWSTEEIKAVFDCLCWFVFPRCRSIV